MTGPAVRAPAVVLRDRVRRLCVSAGFRPVREFAGPGGRPFVEPLIDLPR
jgi:hypothetical protein